MNRVWNRMRQIVWLAVLAAVLLVAAVVVSVLGAPLVGITLGISGVGFALLAQQS